LVRTARITIDQSALALLQRVFRFDPWHVEAPLSARPYRSLVAALVNALRPTTVVEVGCGLGTILSLIEAPTRVGYDRDPGAIRAARFLRGRRIRFVQGDLSSVTETTVDVLILVNWIHEISPDELADRLLPLLPRTRYLVLDALDPDGPAGYAYKHDFAFLQGRARCRSVTRPVNEGRTFRVYEVMEWGGT
jgi:SAM-dependent methyltransferase